MKSRMIFISVAIALLIIPTFLGALPWNNSRASGADAQQQIDGFQVINVLWGTSSSPVSAAPGDRSVPLTVTLQYLFPNTATSVQGLLDLPAGFSLYNGSDRAFSSVAGTMPTGTIFEMTFELYLASNLTLGSYSLPLSLSWTASGYAYVLNQTTDISVAVEGRPQLYFSTGTANLIPGEVNSVPLISYNDGNGESSDIFIAVNSQVAGILNTVPEVQTLEPGSSSTSVLKIYVPISAAGVVVPLSISSTFKDPYGNTVTSSQTLDLYVTPVSQPRIQFVTPVQTLVPGSVNNISIIVQNIGSIGLSEIATSIVSQSQSISVTSTFPYIPSLDPNSSANATVSLYVASSLAGSPISITLTSNYVGQNGVSGTTSQTIGFYASSYNPPVSNIGITIASEDTNLTGGRSSNLLILLVNTGSTTAYSPSFVLSVSSPLVILANSTFSAPGMVIPAGKSIRYEPTLTSSPSSTPGIYSGTLSVTISDQEGNQRTQTFTIGFKLSGSIELVVQDEQITQGTTNLTVSGTLLNQGSTSAYYASILGYVGSQGARGPQSYIGEIDPNTPVPFSVVVPYSASSTPSTNTVNIVLSYKDIFGSNLDFVNSTSTRLTPTASLISPSQSVGQTTTGGLELVRFVLYATIVVIVVAAALGILYSRRRGRRNFPEGKESKVV